MFIYPIYNHNWRNISTIYIGCPTRYRTRNFFNNFTTGWRTAAPCRNNQAHYRHTLQTHYSTFLTRRTYSCSNIVAISSMPGSVASGTPYKTRLASNEIFSPSNKIHREASRAKDLSEPRYNGTWRHARRSHITRPTKHTIRGRNPVWIKNRCL